MTWVLLQMELSPFFAGGPPRWGAGGRLGKAWCRDGAGPETALWLLAVSGTGAWEGRVLDAGASLGSVAVRVVPFLRPLCKHLALSLAE